MILVYFIVLLYITFSTFDWWWWW